MRACVYVDVVVAQVFEAIILRVSIEPSQNCSGDSVQLFDGDNMEVPLSEPVCGSEPPLETFTTRSSVLAVLFQSDESGAGDGFVVGYQVVEGESDEVEIEYPAATGQRKGTQNVHLYFMQLVVFCPIHTANADATRLSS